MTKSEMIKGIASRMVTEECTRKIPKGQSLIMEMAHVATSGDMMIWVWPAEGKNIPHFHVGGLNYGEKWHSCIQILTDDYFLHKGDIPLNAKQKKRLMSMLRAAPDDGSAFPSYWHELIWLWNKVPGVARIDPNTPLRDYDRNLPILSGGKKRKVVS